MVITEPTTFRDPWLIPSLRGDPNGLEDNHDPLSQRHCFGETIVREVYQDCAATVTEGSSGCSDGEHGYGLLRYWTVSVDRSTTFDQEGRVW